MKHLFYLILCFTTTTSFAQKSNTQLISQLDELYSKEFKAGEPGGSILVKKGNEIVYLNNYGLEDLITGKNITENTIFNTGSISKTFVSNGILILNERGALSLDDSLSKYFNDFDNKEIAEKVKIKHMLSHTSGIPDNRKVSQNFDFYLTAKDKENFEPLKHAEHLNSEPGAKYRYSNPVYNGLALIIEKLAHQPWQKFIEENIFKSSGMQESKITNGSYPESGVAHAYVKDKNGQYIENDYGEVPTFAASGNGGIWSSVLDLAKYEEALNKNIFLSKELFQESRKVYEPKNWSDLRNPFIGYSWFTNKERLLGSQYKLELELVYHTGSQGGFMSFYITIPEKDILFIGLFNRPLKNLTELVSNSIMLLDNNNLLE